ncbi:MAG: hypothetical protein LJE89_17635 [Deltaproteobacteria bacterium]|nr:hypothetical protein [Deltaproteobacteria bacterium]
MLKKALSSFLDNTELTGSLAQILTCVSKEGRVTFHEVAETVGDNAEEALLLGDEWRLILPMRTRRTSAWEDRLLFFGPVELYEVPNIVRYLVENASETGLWEPGVALSELFRKMGDPDWNIIPSLVESLWEKSKNYRITAIQIKEICGGLCLGDRVDALIVELKGSGVISPKMRSPAEVSRAGAVIFELNPSLLTHREKIIGLFP